MVYKNKTWTKCHIPSNCPIIDVLRIINKNMTILIKIELCKCWLLNREVYWNNEKIEYAKVLWIINIHLTYNVPRNIVIKMFLNMLPLSWCPFCRNKFFRNSQAKHVCFFMHHISIRMQTWRSNPQILVRQFRSFLSAAEVDYYLKIKLGCIFCRRLKLLLV